MTLVIASLLLLNSVVPSCDDEPVDYLKHVKPILAKHCFACHGSLRQKSDLRLDTISLIREGGASGEVIVTGQPNESRLLDALLGRNDVTKMPPEDSGNTLSETEVSVIERWILAGAKAPHEPIPADPREHWSYRLPQKIPGVGAENPIDHYFARTHREKGVAPQPPATREMLLRRVYLDLIGLPPTIAEIDAFRAEPSKDAYAKVITRLLASQHHGERWGRHWMDVWRYTDWFGLGKEVRYSQKHIWRWRDWIIESLNEDKGYDRMIVEMLAADEVAGDDPDTLRATGFLARNWYLFNRNYWLDDVVHHTSKAFLGVTMNCARCHDHKYDPVAQQEYYQMRAFFEPHRVRLDPVPGTSDLDQDGLPRVFDEELDAPTYLFIRGSEETPDKSRPIPAQTLSVISELPSAIQPIELPVLAYYPALRPQHIDATLSRLESEVEDAHKQLASTRSSVEQLRDQLAVLKDKGTSAETKPTALNRDDFSSHRDELWRQTGGTFDYKNGHVLHTNLAGGQQRLEAKAKLPADFVASLRLKVVGGSTRSIGMAFDVVGDDRIGVYLSPGSRFVSMYQIVNGAETYPARKDLPIKNDEVYDLTFAIRGQLLNVWLNGEFAFAHRLQVPRRAGGFAITNYQAAAEYHEFSLSPLEPATMLAEKTADGQDVRPPNFTPTTESIERLIEQLETQITSDELAITAKEQDANAFRLRSTAERVKYGLAAGDASVAVSQASGAEQKAVRAAASLAVRQAELKLTQEQAKANNDKTIQESKQQLDKARTTLAAAEKRLAVKSNDYAPIGKVYPAQSSGRRTALANWIANRDNPLTARVIVNHIWTRHFGDSLVDSMFDFGLRTKAPLHQPLLDHLSVELMAHGWSMKHLHRLICESNLYQMQSSGGAGSNDGIDPDNKYYWRMNTRRMEHEIVRDSLLSLAGRLDPAIGGPDLPTDQAEKTEGTRRTIYYRHARDDKVRMSRQFDDASVEECYRRKETIVPQQALVLANSDFVRIQVDAIASRLSQDPQIAASEAFVERAFRAILNRQPTDEESSVAVDGMKRLSEAIQKNGASFEDAEAQSHQHLVHVLVMHNDFIMIR